MQTQTNVIATMINYHLFQIEQWFIRRKLRRWAKLLDADQDGVISQDDMMKTNEKLERLRKLVGARQTALSASKQKKWWDDNVFKRGPGKDIHVEEYVTFMEGTLGTGPPHDRAIKIRPVVKNGLTSSRLKNT